MSNLAIMSRNFLRRFRPGTSVPCLDMVLELMRNQGIEVPDRFMGLSRADVERLDSTLSKRVLLEFLRVYLQEISPSQRFAGDVLVMQRGTRVVLGVDAGHGSVLVGVENEGIVKTSLGMYEIVGVFRCQRQEKH